MNFYVRIITKRHVIARFPSDGVRSTILSAHNQFQDVPVQTAAGIYHASRPVLLTFALFKKMTFNIPAERMFRCKAVYSRPEKTRLREEKISYTSREGYI